MRTVYKGSTFHFVRGMHTEKIPNAWSLFHLPSNYYWLNAPTARLVSH